MEKREMLISIITIGTIIVYKNENDDRKYSTSVKCLRTKIGGLRKRMKTRGTRYLPKIRFVYICHTKMAWRAELNPLGEKETFVKCYVIT